MHPILGTWRATCRTDVGHADPHLDVTTRRLPRLSAGAPRAVSIPLMRRPRREPYN
jgi:hypothetical protein